MNPREEKALIGMMLLGLLGFLFYRQTGAVVGAVVGAAVGYCWEWFTTPVVVTRPSQRGWGSFGGWGWGTGKKCNGYRQSTEYPQHVCGCGWLMGHIGPHYCPAPDCPYPSRVYS